MRLVSNPPNPWRSDAVEWLQDVPEVTPKVYEEVAASALQSNDSPDVPFRLGLNPYRGCQHACAYCYARPTHEHLDLGAGTDFDSQLIAKINLPDVLRHELGTGRRRKELVGLSGVTDCYQPLEASYRLTRSCLEALADFRWPVGLITKGVLIERDLDVLTRLHERSALRVFVSIPFASDHDSRAIEPSAPPSSRRFETIRRLSEAGLDVGVAIAPVLPGWNDAQIPEILERATEAGARRAFSVLLRLPGVVGDVFAQRLQQVAPDRAQKVLSGLRDARGGHLQEARFGHRMRGEGPRFDLIQQLFDLNCRRFGLCADREPTALDGVGAGSRRPVEPRRRVQLDLFAGQGDVRPAKRS